MSDMVQTKRGMTSSLIVKRRRAEWRFRAYGVAAIVFCFLAILVLFTSIIGKGYSAFQQSHISVPIKFDAAVIDPDGTKNHDTLMGADYESLVKESVYGALSIPEDNKPARKRAMELISDSADTQLRDKVLADPSIIGKTVEVSLFASDRVDAVLKGNIDRTVPEADRQVSDQQLAWIDGWKKAGKISQDFNTGLFTNGASSKPESAGLLVAIIGSVYMMLIVIFVAVPLGVASAIYLEEFAPKNRWTDLIEVNVNNLAAVPSIVFGLLGLAIFINGFGLPRSASLVGGLVLSLMTLPTIIIATRAALGSIPPSIKEAALGVGASKMQTIFHHVLPLAIPGILTGTIIGLVRALGETAPLLMIGMVAFIVDPPKSVLEPATALPIQIYMWATSAERGFAARTGAATIVLLLFSFLMNAGAIYLRRKFERRW
jgi:phosphate transport system permease protein